MNAATTTSTKPTTKSRCQFLVIVAVLLFSHRPEEPVKNSLSCRPSGLRFASARHVVSAKRLEGGRPARAITHDAGKRHAWGLESKVGCQRRPQGLQYSSRTSVHRTLGSGTRWPFCLPRTGHVDPHLPFHARVRTDARSSRDGEHVTTRRDVLERNLRGVAISSAPAAKLARIAHIVRLEHHLALVGRNGRRNVHFVRRGRGVVVNLGKQRNLVVLRERAIRHRRRRQDGRSCSSGRTVGRADEAIDVSAMPLMLIGALAKSGTVRSSKTAPTTRRHCRAPRRAVDSAQAEPRCGSTCEPRARQSASSSRASDSSSARRCCRRAPSPGVDGDVRNLQLIVLRHPQIASTQLDAEQHRRVRRRPFERRREHRHPRPLIGNGLSSASRISGERVSFALVLTGSTFFGVRWALRERTTSPGRVTRTSILWTRPGRASGGWYASTWYELLSWTMRS